MRKFLLIYFSIQSIFFTDIFAQAINTEKYSIYGPYIYLGGGATVIDIQSSNSNINKTNLKTNSCTGDICELSVTVGSDRDSALSGLNGTIALGYEFLYNKYMLAVEGFASYGDWKNNFNFSGPTDTIIADPELSIGKVDTVSVNVSNKLDYVAGAVARLGYFVFDSTNMYLFAGANYYSFSHDFTGITLSESNSSINPDAYYLDVPRNISDKKIAFVGGLGTEAFFNVNWSVRAECGFSLFKNYSFSGEKIDVTVDFGAGGTLNNGTISYDYANGTAKNSLYMYKCDAGISYHFHS